MKGIVEICLGSIGFFMFCYFYMIKGVELNLPMVFLALGSGMFVLYGTLSKSLDEIKKDIKELKKNTNNE